MENCLVKLLQFTTKITVNTFPHENVTDQTKLVALEQNPYRDSGYMKHCS